MEDLGEVRTLHPTLIAFEEDLFLNFTKQIRSDVCSFHVYMASIYPV